MSPLLLRLARAATKTSKAAPAKPGRTGESVGRRRGRLADRARGAAGRVVVRQIARGSTAAVLTPLAVAVVFAAVALGALLGAALHPTEGTHQ